jgi:hypothetical protein
MPAATPAGTFRCIAMTPVSDDPHPRVKAALDRLAQAEEALSRCRAVWQEYGCAQIPDAHLDETAGRAARARRRRDDALSSLQAVRQMRPALHAPREWLAARLGQEPLHWFTASLVIATPVFVAAAPLLLALGLDFGWVLGGAAAAFLAAFLASAANLWPFDRYLRERRIDDLAPWVSQQETAAAKAEQDLNAAEDRLGQLHLVRKLENEYEDARQHVEDARQHVEKVRKRKADRRYQLAHADWRSLRGELFEDFLVKVFVELGYAVRKTPRTGDQGVDLILIRGGRRIAVQTKGYAGPVGNAPVQEVHAGMTFHRCDRCVAVTNSSFTAGARELAEAVGCLLIDGSMIRDLIAGRIPLTG